MKGDNMLLETITPLSEIKAVDGKPETTCEKPLTQEMVNQISKKICEKLGLHPIGDPERMGTQPINPTFFKARGETR